MIYPGFQEKKASLTTYSVTNICFMRIAHNKYNENSCKLSRQYATIVAEHNSRLGLMVFCMHEAD